MNCLTYIFFFSILVLDTAGQEVSKISFNLSNLYTFQAPLGFLAMGRRNING